ncbi:MAG TPA: FHA domain-containing protein, partial [Acidimicrobiia bacterium]|nr:FHA domain-containing protein [Acidimicrobiia bacterium]
MTDSEGATGPQPKPEVEVETDPTVLYVPIADRAEHPLSADEAAHVEGLSGYAIVVEKGPRKGMTFLLKEGNTTVGRHPESDIFLNDVTVSRHHCRFSTNGDVLTVEDSGSTNGTYVNDERVDSSELSAGDEVLIGRFHFIVVHG